MGPTFTSSMLRIPARTRRIAVAGTCAALFMIVFVLRTVESLDYLTVGILFVLPVALLAVEWGLRVGVAAAVLATILLAVALVIEGQIHSEYLVIRAFVYLLVGIIVGWLADIGRREAQISMAVLNQLAEPAAIKDRHGRYIVVNDAILKALSMTRERMLGRTSHQMGQSGRTAEMHDAAEAEVLRTGQPVQIEFEIVSPSGETRQYISTKSPILDERGVPIGTITTSHDITNRVEHERDVASTAARERAAYAEAQLRYHQLIRHRIANPLTVIRAGAAHLQSDAPSLDPAGIGRMIEEQVERIEHMSLRPEAQGVEEQPVDAGVNAAVPAVKETIERYQQGVRRLDRRRVVSHPANTVEAEHGDEGVAR